LHSGAAGEAYIVTVVGRGYRFTAPVMIEAHPRLLNAPTLSDLAGLPLDTQAAHPDQPATQANRSHRPSRHTAWLAAAAIMLLASAFILWQMLTSAGHQQPLAVPPANAPVDRAMRNPAAAWTDGHMLRNSRVRLLFGSSSTGYTTENADRMDAIVWIDSAGKPISNYITQADRHCGDAIEYFGGAYGNGTDGRPWTIVPGTTSTWSGGAATSGDTVVTSSAACSAPLDAGTASHYSLSSNPGSIDALKSSRTFRFTSSALAGDFRPYVPRVPAASYPYVIYPDASNTLHIVHAVNCSHNCVFANWNGRWMADDNGHGQGIALFREPDAAFRTEITVDYDDDSRSNVSAITLVQPSAGWRGAIVTATEYLCFYDATSWTPSERTAGTPPRGCADVPH
jgi:hypothetical protein